MSDSEDESSDGEWVTMEHSDVEGGEEEEVDPEVQADTVQRAKEVSMTRLLTPADFAAIKKAQLQAAMDPKAAKRQRDQPQYVLSARLSLRRLRVLGSGCDGAD